MGLACARACGRVHEGPSLPLRPQDRVLLSHLHRRASGSGHSLLEDPSPGPGSLPRLSAPGMKSVAPPRRPRPPLVQQALGDCPVTPYFTDDETGLSTTFTTPALRAPAQRGRGRGPRECLGLRAGSSRAGILAPASLGHGPVPGALWACSLLCKVGVWWHLPHRVLEREQKQSATGGLRAAAHCGRLPASL